MNIVRRIFNSDESKIKQNHSTLAQAASFFTDACLDYYLQNFYCPSFEYGDILYDKAFNASFQQKVESIRYNTCLAITGAIRGSSRDKIYEKLGLESIQHRQWYRKLCYFYELYNRKSPNYLPQLISLTPKKYITLVRSSPPEVFLGKGVLKICKK